MKSGVYETCSMHSRPIVHVPSRDVVAAWRSWDTMPIATRRFIDYMSSHIVN